MLAFARREEVEQYLEPLREATVRLFPTGRVRVNVDTDVAYPSDLYILFDVEVSERDVPDYVAARHQWVDELYRLCPAPKTALLRLYVNLVAS